jgi:hypothetical protein
MYDKPAPQTKSFIILAIVAILGTFLAVFIDRELALNSLSYRSKNFVNVNSGQQNNLAGQQTQIPKQSAIDTSDWNEYTDDKFNFSFNFPPDWKVLAPAKKKGDFYVLEIDPGKKFYNILVYISSKDYYALSGVPIITEAINGITAINLNNVVYGIQANDYYYTFDIGSSLSLQPMFQALVHTVKFE